MNFRRPNPWKKYIYTFLILALIGAASFLSISPMFEKDKPIIEIDENIYWNLKDDIDIRLSDQSGIKYYRITFVDDQKVIELDTQILIEPQKEIDLKIKPPKLDMFFKGQNVSIVVEAIDGSKWNFFDGNGIKESFKIKVDRKRPVANVISNTLAIRKGGSAVAIVQVKDENLKEAYISFNDELKLKLTPFYKDDYYISLIPWPVTIEEFKRVNLVAIDRANNITKTKIPLYIRPLKVNHDHIKVSPKFIENVSQTVLEQSGEMVPESLTDIFLQTNRYLRDINVKTIRKVGLEYMGNEMVNDFNIEPFKRLSGSKRFAGYADRRHYYLNGKKIDEAWHLGIDWASFKQAPIELSNPGKVIFNEYLGIYGNTLIVDHGIGLSSLYAHTSSFNVSHLQDLDKGMKIGNTGATGAVFGDHLHFGILVQGIEVNPSEWMDKNWIKSRITDIIVEAKKIIDTKSNI